MYANLTLTMLLGCKKYNFRNMSLLVDKISERLINNGLFLAQGSVPGLWDKTSRLSVLQFQTGSVRVVIIHSINSLVLPRFIGQDESDLQHLCKVYVAVSTRCYALQYPDI
jgi:hypothetical protein